MIRKILGDLAPNMLKGQIRLFKQNRYFLRKSEELNERVCSLDVDYRAYLELQLRRTLNKRNRKLPVRGEYLIKKTADNVDIRNLQIVCIGCRNVEELMHFKKLGAGSVVGVDLYTEHPWIHVMDMHSLTFDDSSFDVVYASHTLEHALDPEKVISEFLRVVKTGGVIVIEVPVNYPLNPGGADLVDYESLDRLHSHFGDNIDNVLWSEFSPSKQIDSGLGTDVVRTILKIKKSAHNLAFC